MERILTAREQNRAVLARQMLLRRTRAPLVRAVERMGGIQAQYAPSAYIGLWTRMERFDRTHLTRALEQRRVIQGTLMRSTIHVVSRNDYWLMAAGTRRARREWWLRNAASRGLGGVDYERMARHLRARLANGSVTRTDLLAALEAAGFPRGAWEGVGAWIDLVRVPPSGTWERRRADLFGDANTWVGEDTADEHSGLDQLLRRYLGAFGPATVADAATWAGVPTSSLAEVAEGLKLRTFRSEDGAVLVDLPRLPIPDADSPAPVRFLGTWDAMLLVHARSTGVLPEEYRPLVFHTKNPASVNTFLVDGAVAGAWRAEGGSIRLDHYHPLPRQARRALEDEASRLAAFLR